MSQRLNWRDNAPHGFRSLLALESHVRESGLDRRLVELVYLRVSLMNGCAFCIDMHTKDLLAAGDSPERLALVSAFREAGERFTPREHAALAWAEAVTALGFGRADDEPAYRAAHAEFGDGGIAELTLAIATINAWNRMGVAMRATPDAK